MPVPTSHNANKTKQRSVDMFIPLLLRIQCRKNDSFFMISNNYRPAHRIICGGQVYPKVSRIENRPNHTCRGSCYAFPINSYFSSINPQAGAVGPAAPLSFAARISGMHCGSSFPRPTSSSVPVMMRTIL